MLLLLKSRIFPVGLLIMNILSKPTCWRRKRMGNLLWLCGL
jgi:hypothetical protein